MFNRSSTERVKDTQERLNTWMEKYSNDYISRSLKRSQFGDDSQKTALEIGRIESEEEALRRTMKFSFPESRQEQDIDISKLVADLKSEKIKVIVNCDQSNLVDFVNDPDQKQFTPEPLLVRNVKNRNASIEPFLNHHQLALSLEEEYKTGYKAGQVRCSTQVQAVNIAIDMCLTVSVYKEFSKLWQHFECSPDVYYKLTLLREAYKLGDTRSDIYSPLKCQINLSDGPNIMGWYGHYYNPKMLDQACVLLVRGKADNIISKGNPKLLLSPWENKGEFFSLELNQEDTIVIGSQKILSPYVDKVIQGIVSELNPIFVLQFSASLIKMIADYARTETANYFYIEDLNVSQLLFFQVPKELCNATQVQVLEEHAKELNSSI